nr:alanine/glycine:cation symporter family protein [uncultured Mediterraneibacter sp.]
MIKEIVQSVYLFLWGDLIHISLPDGSEVGLSLMIILLIPTGLFFSVKTRFMAVRLIPDMLKALKGKRRKKSALSPFQALLVSTATRVGMGNLIGVVVALSAGGPGAVFWMWLMAVIGASTAFIESTLAQLYKRKDPIYGGYRGGPAYYIHDYVERKLGRRKRRVLCSSLFAISALICWCGISQVISNSVANSFENAFGIPPIYTTIFLVIIAAFIVLRKDMTVRVLDMLVPVMALCYFGITAFAIVKNIQALPGVFVRIFEGAFDGKKMMAGGMGVVIMNGVKRGLFSNEAGSGSAPCAAAAADCECPAQAGLVQALGVFIDTIVICSCTAFNILLVQTEKYAGLEGMKMLQKAMEYHIGKMGGPFVAVMLFLFSFSTFLGMLFYARSNVAYLFGDDRKWQNLYKILSLVMLLIGGLEAYSYVWLLGDIGVGLMTVFNVLFLYLMSNEAIEELKKYKTEC